MPTQEIVAQRTKTSRTYTTEQPGVYETRVFSGDVNFQKPDGSWDDIDNLLQPVANGWVAETSDIRFGYEDNWLTLDNKGRTVAIRPNALVLVDMTNPTSRRQVIATADYSGAVKNGNTVNIANIFPGIDYSVQYTPYEMSKAFTLHAKPTLPDPLALGWNPATTYLVTAWDLTRPGGYRVVDTVTGAQVGAGYWGDNDLRVETGSGDPVAYFAHGIATSASRRENPIHYMSLGSALPFGEAFEYSKVQVATYPLVLDPTTNFGVTASASDGVVYNDGGYTGVASTVEATAEVGSSFYDDGKGYNGWNTFKAVFKFNLSNISGTVSSATFNVSKTNTTGTPGNVTVDRIAHSNYSVTAADYDASVVETIASNYTPVSGVNSWSITSAITLGTTGIAVRISAPNATYDSYTHHHSFGTVDNSSTGLRPYLALTWSPGTTYNTSGTSHVIWRPGDSVNGDRLFLVGVSDSTSGLTLPAGWNYVGYTGLAPYVALAVYYKDLGASEPDSWTATTSASRYYGWKMFRLGAGTYASDAPQIGTDANGTGFYPDAASITPSWGNTAPTWFLTLANLDSSDTSPENYPSGYATGAITNLSSRAMWWGTKTATVSSEDAGQWESYYSVHWGATTVAQKMVSFSNYSGSFTADAYIQNTTAQSVTADAYIRRTRIYGSGGSLTQVIGQDDFSTGSPQVGTSWTGDWTRQPGYFIDEGAPYPGFNGTSTGQTTSTYHQCTTTLGLAFPYALGDGYVDATINGGASIAVRISGSYSYNIDSGGNLTRGFDGPIIATTGGVGQNFRIQVTGHSPTTIKVERRNLLGDLGTGWQIETTDNTAGYQRATGDVGLTGYEELSWSWENTEGIWETFGSSSSSADNFKVVGFNLPDGPGFTADAQIAEGAGSTTYEGSFTADAYIQKTTEGSLTANAVIDPAWGNWSATWQNTNATTNTGSFTANAYIKNTTAGSLTANAYIKNTLAGSITANANIKATLSGTLTANAYVKNTLAGSLTANAYILKTTAGSYSADAYILKTTSGSFSADAYIDPAQATTYPGSFTADAYVKATVAGSLTADSYIKQTTSGSLTADAYVKQTTSGTFTANAYLKQTYSGSVTADAYLRNTTAGTFTAAAYILKTTAQSLTADAYVLKTTAGAMTADAYVRQTTAGSLSADAFIAKTYPGSFTADAVIDPTWTDWSATWSNDVTEGAITRNGSFTLDAHIKAAVAGTFTADAHIKAAVAGSLTADAYVKNTLSGSLTADAYIKQTTAGSFTANAYVKQTLGGSFTADAYTKNTYSGTLTANAFILKTTAQTFTADAHLKGTVSGSFTADAEIAVTGTIVRSFTADAYVKNTVLGSLTANAYILKTFSGSLTADAYILKTTAGSLTANAYLKKTLAGSFSADANVKATVVGSITANAEIAPPNVGTVSGSFTADAYVKATRAGSLTADAYIKQTFVGSLSASAYIKATQQGTVTVDAYILKTSAGSLTANAYVKQTSIGTLTADAYVKVTLAGALTADAFVKATTLGTFTADARIVDYVPTVFGQIDVDEVLVTSIVVEEASRIEVEDMLVVSSIFVDEERVIEEEATYTDITLTEE